MLIKKFLLILLLSIFTLTISVDPIELDLDDNIANTVSFSNTDEKDGKLFSYHFKVITNDYSYYIIRTYDDGSEISESPMHLFYHKDQVLYII